LRPWRKGKSEATLEPQRVNCSNLNINISLENLILCKFLDAGSTTSVPPIVFCLTAKKLIENLSVEAEQYLSMLLSVITIRLM
jgi:hypothetical protein